MNSIYLFVLIILCGSAWAEYKSDDGPLDPKEIEWRLLKMRRGESAPRKMFFNLMEPEPKEPQDRAMVSLEILDMDSLEIETEQHPSHALPELPDPFLEISLESPSLEVIVTQESKEQTGWPEALQIPELNNRPILEIQVEEEQAEGPFQPEKSSEQNIDIIKIPSQPTKPARPGQKPKPHRPHIEKGQTKRPFPPKKPSPPEHREPKPKPSHGNHTIPSKWNVIPDSKGFDKDNKDKKKYTYITLELYDGEVVAAYFEGSKRALVIPRPDKVTCYADKDKEIQKPSNTVPAASGEGALANLIMRILNDELHPGLKKMVRNALGCSISPKMPKRTHDSAYEFYKAKAGMPLKSTG